MIPTYKFNIHSRPFKKVSLYNVKISSYLTRNKFVLMCFYSVLYFPCLIRRAIFWTINRRITNKTPKSLIKILFVIDKIKIENVKNPKNSPTSQDMMGILQSVTLWWQNGELLATVGCFWIRDEVRGCDVRDVGRLQSADADATPTHTQNGNLFRTVDDPPLDFDRQRWRRDVLHLYSVPSSFRSNPVFITFFGTVIFERISLKQWKLKFLEFVYCSHQEVPLGTYSRYSCRFVELSANNWKKSEIAFYILKVLKVEEKVQVS